MTAFRWGILGTGTVAAKFALGLRAARTPAVPVAVASRDPAKAARLAAALGARAGTYAEVIGSGDLDAMYIATPPSLHAEQAVRCIEAGIPALVEKPFAADLAGAQRIADAASAAGVFAMEGLWTRFLPLMAEIRARLAAGDLGEVRAFSGSFAIADVPSRAAPAFDPAAGGGALSQRGVYALSIACHLLGPVAAISGYLRQGETGVDEDALATARHTGGAVSQLHASLVTSAPNDFLLAGTAGLLRVEAPIYRPSAMRLTRLVPRPRGPGQVGIGPAFALAESGLAHGLARRARRARRSVAPGGERVERPFAGNGYSHEADAVMEAVRAGWTEHPLMPVAESVHVVDLMDRLRHENAPEPAGARNAAGRSSR